jgi:sucrose-6-phosphate hydrolase SacC (GH32 family)
MAVAAANDFTIEIYTSPNLTSWTLHEPGRLGRVVLERHLDQVRTFVRESEQTVVRKVGGPVLSVGSNQFRDPKVFWYEDHWVMAVAAANDFT